MSEQMAVYFLHSECHYNPKVAHHDEQLQKLYISYNQNSAIKYEEADWDDY